MNKQIRNWKLIFNTNNFHSVFIKGKNSVLLLYKYIEEISSEKDFLILIPTLEERNLLNYSNHIIKFAQTLKKFIEDKNKKH